MNIGEKYDQWRQLHKGSLDSMYDAFAAGHCYGAEHRHDEVRELESELAAVKEDLVRVTGDAEEYDEIIHEIRAIISARTEDVQIDVKRVVDERVQLRARIALFEKLRVSALNLLKGTPTRIDGTFCPHNQPQIYALHGALKAIDAAGGGGG